MHINLKKVNDGYAIFLAPSGEDQIKEVHFPYPFPVYCYPDLGTEPKTAEVIRDSWINIIAADYQQIKKNFKKINQKISIDLDEYKVFE